MRFPLGDLRKTETRALAAQFGLDVAAKSDSQDICFVPTGRYTQVIEKLRPGAAEAGLIVHVDGRTLGRHAGIINYTIGQRRGIGVAGAEPLYVVRLDAERREVIVGPREALRTHTIRLREVNWIGEGALADLPAQGLAIEAKIRSSQPPRPATLFNRDGAAVVSLHDGEDGVSPGQACVFYAGTRVLGGGWIEATGTQAPARAAPATKDKTRVLPQEAAVG
jgi:tRNA-specific 2-thiouridylase